MPNKDFSPVKTAPHSKSPYPWRCRHCGQVKVDRERIDYPAEVKYDGRLVSFVARGIDIPICRACGEKVFTEEVDQQINQALRTHFKLLTPSQIQSAIGQLGLTESQLAERLGIAETTLSRWLDGSVVQPRAMDNYVRIFFHFPDVRATLETQSMAAEVGLVLQ
jgi:DNA-binding transcriptional regulator YiaG